MASKFGTWRQKIKQHPVVTVVIIAAIGIGVALIVVIVLGYLYHWDWTGLNGGYSKITRKNVIVDGKPADTDQAPAKNLWDWWQLLAVVAIPVVAGFGAAWFTVQHGKVSERENKDNQREKALQDYIDKMSALLLERHLRASKPADEVRTIARVRTLTVLRGLDSMRKASVIQFLHESGLIYKDKCIISLNGADLSKANLSEADLREANLSEADFRGVANLRIDYLRGANLRGASLRGVDLSEARDLTQEQIDQVLTCKGAILPKGLTCHHNP